MTALDTYKVRPSPEKAPRDVFKILLSPSNLLLRGMKPGSVCTIKTSQGPSGPAIAWNTSERIKDDVVQISRALQKVYGLKLDSRISISPSNDKIEDASEIVLCEVSEDETDFTRAGLDKTGRLDWAVLLKFAIRKADILSPGLTFELSEPENRTFQIQRINASDKRVLYRAQVGFKVCIIDLTTPDDKHRKLFVHSEGLGGLKTQVQQINNQISLYNELPGSRSHLPDFCKPCGVGLILHGAPGTGKSLVLQKIAEAGWQGVFRWNPNLPQAFDDDGDAGIARVFTEALLAQPSVIIIDSLDLDNTANNVQNSSHSVNVNKLLCKQLDRLDNSSTFVAAATRRLSDIDQSLRQADRLAKHIEIPVPDSDSRAEILKILGRVPKDSAHPTLDSIAARTHGFVGADLKLLFGTAVELHLIRTMVSRSDGKAKGLEKVDPGAFLAGVSVDFDIAFPDVHPSAMHNVFIESPNVRWTDIGGQHKVKDVLEQALVWPFKYSEILRKHRSKPKKGLLLYGPPGCSKTMTAKAAATESGLNFLTVKGAELTSMYVGESERKLRDIFSKARAVRPSVIFFDEIDAIGATGETHAHNGVQTVTTLLNELDGFEAMKGVYVLAATNKPETLDTALIRAGRLDTCLYVGLPDLEARRDILKLGMRDMELAHDVEGSALAEATDGHSGAEITQICEQARDAAMREEIETQKDQLVSQRHFKYALTQVEKSVTQEMVRRYKAWGAGRH